MLLFIQFSVTIPDDLVRGKKMKLSRRELANAIRVLSMDAVQKANSGHPGMPMGMADIAEVLWNDFLEHNPKNPHWQNRDRFVVSNGHGSMLLYSLLHLTGYALTIDDLRQFRQLHSKTPGHPEFGETPGVETTTGPLGQGLANAVGMAIAEKHLAAQFNRPGLEIVDHYTYVFAGDGCLMEGISHEVCSLAGTLGLGKLIVFYDDNEISIDGKVHGWFTDDTPKRFEAYGWHAIPNVDGHNSESVREAILLAQSEKSRPTIICCKTEIGKGAPNRAGTAKAHGEALGEEEVLAARKQLHWTHEPFVIPENYYHDWDATKKGTQVENIWQAMFSQYEKNFPKEASEFKRRIAKKLPDNFTEVAEKLLQDMNQKKENVATRKASQMCINHFADILPEFVGGSADLTGSNLTQWKTASTFSRENPSGQYIFYGVREFGMSAIMNGLALYGGIIPFGGTFLTFSDYARNAVRMAALMKQRVIFVYTHDSIGLGEDGPTHQAIEHAPSLRLIPQLSVWRPCDTVESAVAWQFALSHQGPTCLLFSRQNLPCQTRDAETLSSIQRGGYILQNCEGTPDVILIATGSEVALAVDAARQLTSSGRKVRVVSMPSTDVFLAQDAAYREKVLPAKITQRIAIEAAASGDWYRFVGGNGRVLGLDHFGYSAPAKDVFKACHFTVENICALAESYFSVNIEEH
ncbi:MAG: transketolase [Gammaproteobacteria bacterium]|nr:transketolase [Gammaproteobacteria bacterium]